MMLNEFNKYKFIKKSESELASEEIVNKLSNKLWRDSGYHVAYMLGVVNYLSGLAKQMRSYDTLSKRDLIRCIELFKDGNETPDEIKKLVDIVLEELKEKEN
jgi:superfamily I DNA and RNA helicase